MWNVKTIQNLRHKFACACHPEGNWCSSPSPGQEMLVSYQSAIFVFEATARNVGITRNAFHKFLCSPPGSAKRAW